MTRSTNASLVPPAVAAYGTRHRLGEDSFGSDGTLSVTFDDQYRVRLRPASGGRIALVALLLELDALAPSGRDDAIVHLAGLGAGLLQGYASTLSIDASAQWLVLQQVLPAGIGVEGLEEELGDFVNALAFWTSAASALPAERMS